MLIDWFCSRDRLGLTSIFFYLYFSGIWPGRCNYPVWGLYPGFSGAFPEAETGWTTMVVTAAVYLEFEDPNGWISN